MSRKPHRPISTCSACGGDWFREASYYAFLPEKDLYIWETWPDLTGQASIVPMTVAVCLCGTRLDPVIGGVRGGRTPKIELTRFLDSLQAGKARLMKNHAPESILQAAEEELVGTDDLQALEERLGKLQTEIGRRTHSGRGRHWEQPKRSQKGGSLTRDGLVWKLQESGLEFREARETLNAILKTIARTLKAGETVEVLPLGTFLVRAQPKTRERFRLGKVQTLYPEPRKVVFRPSNALCYPLADCRHWITEEVKVAKNPQHVQCLKCGSTNFMEGQFRK